MKIPLRWMIWGYSYFRKPPFLYISVMSSASTHITTASSTSLSSHRQNMKPQQNWAGDHGETMGNHFNIFQQTCSFLQPIHTSLRHVSNEVLQLCYVVTNHSHTQLKGADDSRSIAEMLHL